MPRAILRDPIYRGRRFSVDVIELCGGISLTGSAIAIWLR